MQSNAWQDLVPDLSYSDKILYTRKILSPFYFRSFGSLTWGRI